MLKQELENLVGYEIEENEFKQLNKMYMTCDLNKYEFAKLVKPTKLIKEKKIVTICTRDNSGYSMTPNNNYYHTIKAELIDINIKKGKVIIKKIPNSYDLRYSYDYDITQCEVNA